MSHQQIHVAIDDPTAVSQARQSASAMARLVDLDPTAAGRLAIAVTEASGNVVKHASAGSLLLRPIERGGCLGVEVLVLDRGPGMQSIAECMRDGFSTAGSPGTGMGALKRMTSAFELWSRPGSGTLMRFEVWSRAAPEDDAAHCVGVVNVAKPGETECGDGWAIVRRDAGLMLFVVDGLGHGAPAATAARMAVDAATRHSALAPVDIIDAVHGALVSTRGAAAAVAMLDQPAASCVFCGVGNISATLIAGGRSRQLVSHNGILGHQLRRLQPFQYPMPGRALLIAHSDGINTRWDLGAYPGLEARHPALIAAALFRDHQRGRDDATVVAVTMKGAA